MPSFTVDDLRCEYQTNPLGLDEAKPRLSWKLRPSQDDQHGLRQGSYRVLVASSAEQVTAGKADVWDSGEVASDQSVFVDYAGPALKSGQRVWWTVRVTDAQGNTAELPPAAFWEAGLLQRDAWQGRWIGSNIVGGVHTPAPVPMLRQSFEVPLGRRVKRARIYATALGVYEMRLNGRRVGDQILAPGWTDYRHCVRYQAYDVTDMVHGGENAVGVLLGDGWYCGNTGNIGRRQFYGDRPWMLAQLEVTLDDDSVITVATDESWRVSQSPIVASDFFAGENYDARLEQPGWDSPSFAEDERWSAVRTFEDPDVAIVPMAGPPVRATMELTPVEPPLEMPQWWGKTYRFDFGQNLVGGVRLKVKGPAGATVTLKFAEVLNPDGTLHTANLRNAKQTDTYTLRGDPDGEVFETRFTFHGFRYAAMIGFPGQPTAESLTAIVLHSDMPKIGTFECSDPLVNQLCHNIEWGQRGNFLDVPTDCPQRDERLGWTGDAQVFARTAAFNFDVSGFFAKWTQDMRDAQGPLGSYPPIVPNNGRVYVENDIEHTADGGPAWADAGVICPWTMLLCYGDRKLIAEHYESMVRFVERLRATSEPYGLIRAHPDWAGWLGYGDWLSQDGKDGLFGSTPKDLIGTAFMAYDAQLLSRMAAMLDKQDDAKRYADLAEQTKAAFCRRYVTPDGLMVGNTQTAYLLALHFDLLPAELRPQAVTQLVNNIKANQNRLNTGFVGSPYLNQVLTAAGRLDVAYTLLMQKQWPSWLYAVTHGATTIWERWDGWTHDRGFQDAGMNSFNHYAYGAIGAWLYHQCAGLDLDEQQPGYKHLKFHPHPLTGGPLTFARATLQTPYGHAESGWTLEDTKLTFTLSVPPNTTATAHIPAADVAKVTCSGRPLAGAPGITSPTQKNGHAVVELAPGRYQFESVLPPAPPVAAAARSAAGHEGSAA